MKKLIAFLTTAIVLVNFTAYAQQTTMSDVPRTISYQGYLVDAMSNPLTGDHTIAVHLYDSPIEGTLLHSEIFTTRVERGVFSIAIGSSVPIESSLHFDKPYWLGVSVDGGGELSPRTALASVPYAIHADAASSLSKGAAGAVTTVNGRSGDLILKAGEGTFLQTEGKTITINAISAGNSGGNFTQGLGNVSSVTGTTNQITASPTSGNVVLTLPQNIHSGATPVFAGMTLSGLSTSGVVHNNGTGALSTSSIVNADVSATADIADTKLATISTSGKVSNSATTATSTNTANTIVLRDGSGNFSAGTITAVGMTLSGKVSSAATSAGDPATCLTTKGYVDNSVASAWNTTGNVGLSTDNYLGTNDATDLSLRTSGAERMKITSDGSLVLAGTSGSVPVSGFGTRMMWVPSLGAIRAGRADGSEWDAASEGAQSVAMGYGTLASGAQSVAMGFFSSAYGTASTAFGSGASAFVDGSTALGSAVQAAGYNSVALGDNSTAFGDGSVAIGGSTTANGLYSTTMGYNTTTMSNYGTAMGKNLTVGLSSFGFNGSTTNTTVNVSGMNNVAYFGDVDLIVGNEDNSARALKLYGPNSSSTLSTGKYTAFKARSQSANITYLLPTTQGSSGSVLSNDGVGNLSWKAPVSAYGTTSAGGAITIPSNTSVVKITNDADSLANSVTMPSGTNGQIIYIYNDDDQDTSGDVTIAAHTMGLFVYVDGWRKTN